MITLYPYRHDTALGYSSVIILFTYSFLILTF